MPTYEYKCLQCRHTFEEFQSITAEALEECPECGGKVKRLIGMGDGIIFKGSGFYITDYRSKQYKDAQKKDRESLPTSDSKSGNSSKSKEKNIKKSKNAA